LAEAKRAPRREKPKSSRKLDLKKKKKKPSMGGGISKATKGPWYGVRGGGGVLCGEGGGEGEEGKKKLKGKHRQGTLPLRASMKGGGGTKEGKKTAGEQKPTKSQRKKFGR